jgi:hypothetical protein
LAVGSRSVDGSAGIEQGGDDAHVADRGRFGERRRAELVRGLDVGARGDQPLDEREITVVNGPMQRRRAVG